MSKELGQLDKGSSVERDGLIMSTLRLSGNLGQNGKISHYCRSSSQWGINGLRLRSVSMVEQKIQ